MNRFARVITISTTDPVQVSKLILTEKPNSSTAFSQLELRAHPSNTSTIYCGDASTLTTSNGIPYDAGEAFNQMANVGALVDTALEWVMVTVAPQKLIINAR